MHHDFHRHYLFLRHKEMNAIYLSIFLMNMAESMISIFVPIYLYSLHFSISHIILFALLGNIGSVLFALPAAKVVRFVGHAYSILISVPFLIAYYFGLRVLGTTPWLFYVLPFLVAARSVLYNIGFELNFIQHANRMRMGKTLSLMAIITVMAGIVAPFLAGFLIAWFGYAALFLIGSAILVLSTVPLFLYEEKREPIDFNTRSFFQFITARSYRGGALSFIGYAIESSIGRIIWPIFLIVILYSTETIGTVVALSAFITVAMLSFAGRLTDKFDPRKLLRFGTMLYFFGWIGSVFADSTFKIFFIDSYRNVSGRFILLPWSAAFYRLTKKEHQFYAVVARDFIFNASRVVIMPLLIAVFAFSPYAFVISFLIASLFTLLYPFASSIEEGN
ncbi:MAG: MFS transporter [Candidatus Magasanikbacteria bacterium]|nr:MFS transporter [Candidatus Magasanikbacteria bacterium]